MKKVVELYLTGFGPFGKVDDNPTKYIVQSLRDFRSTVPDVSIKIIDQMLEVKAHEAESFVEKVYAQIYQEACSHPNAGALGNKNSPENNNNAPVVEDGSAQWKKIVLVIHFGVCEEGKRIKLEKCAVNDATFRIPDVSGWQPSHECVCSDDPRMQVLDTSIPVDTVIDMVGDTGRKEENVVESSTDAGRFVCNFLYYWSLKKARETCQKLKGMDVDVKSLFIHVPLFSVMGFPFQSKVVHLVLQMLLQSELVSSER